MQKIFNKVVVWVPAVIWMGIIFYLSSQTNPVTSLTPGRSISSTTEPAGWEEWLDYIFHPLEYALLTLAFYFGWTDGKLMRSNPSWKLMVYSTMMAIGYALIDEVHQIFVPGRSFEVVDISLDMVGAGFAVLGLWLMNRKG